MLGILCQVEMPNKKPEILV